MSELGDNTTIECPEILYRLLTKKSWVSPEGAAEAEAFILRPVDAGKLSVRRKALVSLQACKGQFSRCHGAVTLHAGSVRTIEAETGLNLDVIPDQDPGDSLPGHAAIIHLPDREKQSYLAVERVASLLRDSSRRAEG